MFGAFRHLSVEFFKHRSGHEPAFGLCFFVVCVVLRSPGVEVGGLDAAAAVAHMQDVHVVGY